MNERGAGEACWSWTKRVKVFYGCGGDFLMVGRFLAASSRPSVRMYVSHAACVRCCVTDSRQKNNETLRCSEHFNPRCGNTEKRDHQLYLGRGLHFHHKYSGSERTWIDAKAVFSPPALLHDLMVYYNFLRPRTKRADGFAKQRRAEREINTQNDPQGLKSGVRGEEIRNLDNRGGVVSLRARLRVRWHHGFFPPSTPLSARIRSQHVQGTQAAADFLAFFEMVFVPLFVRGSWLLFCSVSFLRRLLQQLHRHRGAGVSGSSHGAPPLARLHPSIHPPSPHLRTSSSSSQCFSPELLPRQCGNNCPPPQLVLREYPLIGFKDS